MSIDKLLQQKSDIENQIAQAKLAQKNQGRVEKIVLKLLQRHPDILLCDLKILETNLDNTFADLAGNLANRQR